MDVELGLFEKLSGILDKIVETCSGLLGRIVDMLLPVTDAISGLPCMPLCLELSSCTLCCCSNWCGCCSPNLVCYV